MVKGPQFLNDKLCLNVLANTPQNAQEIYEVTEGHVIVGLLSANYETVDLAIEDMKKYDAILNGAVSVGLGAGNPKQWKMVADICKIYKPAHVNQVFSAVGYTRAQLNNTHTYINALVQPTEKPGYVNIATGEQSSEKPVVEAPIESAIAMVKEMGGNSLKFFPMKGLETVEQYKKVAQVCAKEQFALEPTGGIDLHNFEEIVSIALEAGVPKVIPHVYSSIINKETGETNIEDVKQLHEIMHKVGS